MNSSASIYAYLFKVFHIKLANCLNFFGLVYCFKLIFGSVLYFSDKRKHEHYISPFLQKGYNVVNLNYTKKEGSSSNMGVAFKMSTELVAAVAVGTIIGFILDNWFGTKPWLILIFFFVGVIAGIMNVVKSAKRMQK